jgi:hypothetical protein
VVVAGRILTPILGETDDVLTFEHAQFLRPSSVKPATRPSTRAGDGALPMVNLQS